MSEPIVDWTRLGRTVAALVVGWVLVAAIGPAVTAALTGGIDRGVVLLWVGLGTAGLVATLVVAIAVSAVRGMLRAGDRGERLARDDVGLSPPQVRGRRRTEGEA